jgi:transposase
MEPVAKPNNPFCRYPPELRERALRMVHEAVAENRERVGAVTRVARQLGIGPESLRSWLKQAEINDGTRPGVSTKQRRRIAELERENRELRREPRWGVPYLVATACTHEATRQKTALSANSRGASRICASQTCTTQAMMATRSDKFRLPRKRSTNDGIA